MFKKSLAAMVLFATIGVPTVAHAAPAATVSGVKLAWDSAGVRVTWSESAAVANTVTVTRPGQPAKQVGTTAAGGANQLFVDSNAIGSSGNPAEAVFITVKAAGGGEARSAVFDTYLRPPSFTSPTLFSRELNWSLAADTAVDGTPNDPLDVAGPVSITPIMKFADCTVKSQASTTALHGTVPNQGKPFNLTLDGANEWGHEVFDTKQVRTSAVTLNAPASTPYGAPIAFSGKVSVRHIVESGSACVEADDPDRARIQVTLQARNSASSPWYAVTTADTDAQGNYQVTVANPGAREYRVWVNENSLSGSVQYGSVSTAKTVRATNALQSAKFVKPVITLGEKADSTIWVKPEGSQLAVLQYLTPTGAWQHVVTRNLDHGRADSTPFGFNLRGVTPFRWWVSGVTTATGLPVDPIYTPTFTLTVK